MVKFIINALFLLSGLTFLNAQPKEPEISIDKNVTLTGKILDKDTQQPLEYASVAIFSKKQNKIIDGSITDINGDFSITLKNGVYDILIEYISYKTITYSDKNIQSDEDLGTILMEIDYGTLDAVEIIAEKTTVEVRLDKKIYNVGKDLTVSGGTVSDVLDNVPSVSIDGEGNVALRGNDNVRILINGKPSGLVGLNSTEALRQLPAEAIEKVEVITSPSARYEAEGTAGILNIILRRSKLQGFNGSLTANVGYPDTAGLSGNINYRTGNVNIFNTTAYNYRERLGRWFNDVRYFDIETPDLNERRNWIDIRKGITTNTGVEWYINDLTSLIASVVYRDNNSENNSINRLTQFNKIDNSTNESVRQDPEKEDSKTIQYALNLSKNFKESGHKLTLDFQYEDNSENENSIITVDGVDSEIVTTFEEQSNILLQSDYILPISEKSQIEIGFRGDYSTRITDFEVSIFNTNSNEFVLNNNLSNVFNFKQYITAAYTQFGSKIGKFSYLLGLRMENTKLTLDQPTSGDFERKNLVGLFPTINLNYEFSETQSMSLGFNRRLRRPRSFMLNPFPSRSSLTNVFQGDPGLVPAYSNTVDLGYINRLDKLTIATSVYYARTTDVISFVSRETGEFVIIDDEAFPVVERGPVNLATDTRYGLELNLNYSPSRKWRINSDFNIFNLSRSGDFNGIDLGADNMTWTARLNNKLTLPYKIDWQTNINYRGPFKDAQNDRNGIFRTDIAFSKDLFNEKASIAFNVRDVFNTAFFSNNITAETFTAYQEIQFRGGRIYNLAFTYRFNQNKKREREGGGFSGGGMDM